MDKDILLRLYKTQVRIIYGYLLSNGCSSEEVEDIIQDSFIKAIEHMDGVDISKLSSWIFKVALNNCRNTIRRKKSRKQISIDEEEFYNKFVLDEDFTDKLIFKENNKKVRSTPNKMKDGYKDLLILKYEIELSHLEIGKLLNMNENTVSTYLYRARNQFKRLWGIIMNEIS
ncbi:RNA polymerase sigma factor [Clostridium sp. Marseille-Q7071]